MCPLIVHFNDLEPLTGLTNLYYLDLGNNLITNIQPLVQNTGIGSNDYVNLTGNPLDDISINTYIPQLQARGVTVNYTIVGTPRQ